MARKECGIVETDETWFLRSYKGQRGGLPRKARKRGGRGAKQGFSREHVPVLVVRDRSGSTSDAIHPKGHPSGDQSRAGIPPGSGCGPLLGRGKERPYRPGGSGDGGGPSGGESEQGDQSHRRRLPYPKCERLPFAAERVNATVPRGGHKIP